MARFTEKRLSYMLDHFNDENALDSREAYLDYLISGIPSQSWGDILEDIDAQVRNQDLMTERHGYRDNETMFVKAKTKTSVEAMLDEELPF